MRIANLYVDLTLATHLTATGTVGLLLRAPGPPRRDGQTPADRYDDPRCGNALGWHLDVRAGGAEGQAAGRPS
jgi:hypothetical protein